MAQQGIKVRPVLLKRNSLDSVDFKRQPHHRRSKSQQVRFKDEGTDNPTVAESELEAEVTQESCTLDKMQTSQHHNLVNNSLCFPHLTKDYKILPFRLLQALGNTVLHLKGKELQQASP
ncbi:hypothetical protein JRQ81_002439 [Phrynocephalus forsythii]|uniref:Uncharacterized protein n=1 Tax=Phrynocephalus forsythii TaxID=171643 RepID=A0A9Q1AVZ3_9SAUR|nr:hypothetical protein JRQ81_002439 [Phrynocephalus forsythii]